MIRLSYWHRTLGVLLLVGAVAGGVAVTADGPAERADATPAAQVDTVDTADVQRQDQERADSERAARDAAQRKADEAAVAAAEQAKKVASPSQSKKSGPAAPPAPESCNIYSGNRRTGCAMVLAKGWDLQQMGCLDKLWNKESSWNEKARNRSSGAYGIPQAYPGHKMSSAGSDWETNPVTQIKWGLGYISQRYGTPCKAWATSQSTGSY